MAQAVDARVTRVVEAIRRYLAEHPEAADSAQGIAAWWMPAMAVETSAEEVGVALEQLHLMELIDRQTLPDGRVIYRARSSARGR